MSRGPHGTLAANCPYRKNLIRQREETEQRLKQDQTHSTYAEIAKHVIQQTNPPQHTLTLTNQTHIKLTALIKEAHIATLDKTKKFGDIPTESLKLSFNIDTTFPDRDSTAIFNFYYDKTDSQQPQMTQTAPQEEHTIDQTIDTEMDEADTATYTEIRQKRRISDGMEDSKLIMDNKYTVYVKLYKNYDDSSPISDNPTKDWFPNELDKDQDNDRVLKLFTQDLDHQPVVEMLRRRRVQENENFDTEHINRIQQHMNNIIHEIAPYDTGDINRLDPLHFPPITPDELLQTLTTFKQKAPDPTGITTLQLKQLQKNMINYLLYIFNISISAGYFPDKLKHATMIFLPKPNTSQKSVENYRPISLLDVHGTLLDKILNRRLTNYITIHDHYNIRKHGFRQYRGIHTALATLHETIAINRAQKHTIDIVLRDVSKAFDRV
ncbi:Reverse transcriptase domain [Trinorchestia longiramus]|nr:Reverse transcriptase domain [Trinorchestia longiramus]